MPNPERAARQPMGRYAAVRTVSQVILRLERDKPDAFKVVRNEVLDWVRWKAGKDLPRHGTGLRSSWTMLVLSALRPPISSIRSIGLPELTMPVRRLRSGRGSQRLVSLRAQRPAYVWLQADSIGTRGKPSFPTLEPSCATW